MLGMIKKDLYMVKNNSKLLGIWIVMIVVFSLSGNDGFYIMLPLLALMLSISTFSYDEYNNWNTYLSALPSGKKNVVKAKYIFSLLLVLITTIISVIIVQLLSKPEVLEENMSALLGSTLGMLFIASILFPLFYKYGSEKGRLLLLLICLGIGGGFGLLSEAFNFKISPEFIKYLDDHFIFISIIVTIIVLLIYVISFVISKKIYEKKEF